MVHDFFLRHLICCKSYMAVSATCSLIWKSDFNSGNRTFAMIWCCLHRKHRKWETRIVMKFLFLFLCVREASDNNNAGIRKTYQQIHHLAWRNLYEWKILLRLCDPTRRWQIEDDARLVDVCFHPKYNIMM